MAATKPRDLTPAGTWVGTTLSNLWLWAYLNLHWPAVTLCLLLRIHSKTCDRSQYLFYSYPADPLIDLLEEGM